MIVEAKSIFEYTRTDADAIAFEVSCTTKLDGFASKQHPRCYDEVYRVFGKEWLYVLGANMRLRLEDNKGIDLNPVPMGYSWGKLLVGLPIKPNTSLAEGFEISEEVKKQDAEIPGYLMRTRIKDVEELTKNLVSFADKLRIKKMIVSPVIVTDSYLTNFTDISYIWNQYLDDRFIVARKGF